MCKETAAICMIKNYGELIMLAQPLVIQLFIVEFGGACCKTWNGMNFE